MTISFSGLASGLDTSSWVESLTALKKAKVTALEEEKSALEITKDAVASIKSFFTSFRSTIEKITDSKMFSMSSMDIFAQNLATSSNINVLTATATSEAKEAIYEVQVDKLASNTQATSKYSYTTTIIESTTATLDSKLTDLTTVEGDVEYKIQAGNIGVRVKGAEYGISITDDDTIATFINKLKNIGVDASYNEQTGVFSMNVGTDDINDIDGTNIAKVLHLEGVNEGYISNTLNVLETVYSAATESTRLVDLGVNIDLNVADNNKITVRSGEQNYQIALDEYTDIGDLVSSLVANGIDASFNSSTGIFSIRDAEIIDEGTTNIIDALGLTTDVYQNKQVSGELQCSTVTTVSTSVTGDTTLGEIITALGKESDVSGGYNLELDGLGAISVNENTTVDELINAINTAAGYTVASLSGGRLLVEDYELTGSVATALGMSATIVTTYVEGTGSSVLYTKTVEYADRNTLLSDVGVSSNTAYKIYTADGSLVDSLNVTPYMNIGHVLDDWANLYGIHAEINDGVISITSSDNGYYVDGALATLWGIGHTTVTTILESYMESNDTVYSVTTATASLTTTLGCLYYGCDNLTLEGSHNLSNPMSTLEVIATEGHVGYVTILTGDTIGDMFDKLSVYGITGTISNGIITLTSAEGNFVDDTTTRGLLSRLGIGVTDGDETTSTVIYDITSTAQVTYGATVQASGSDYITDFVSLSNNEVYVNDKNGNLKGTITINSNTTFNSFMSQLSALGIDATMSNGVMTFTPSDGEWMSGEFIEDIGLSTTVTTIHTTTTVGRSVSSSAPVTYEVETGYATESSQFGDLTPTAVSNGNNVIQIKDSDGNILDEYTATSTSTLEDFFNAISAYGISGSISNGVISLSSTNGVYVQDENTGGVLDALGISNTVSTVTRTLTQTVTTTTGVAITSSTSVAYTEDGGTATASTTFGELAPTAISNGKNEIYIRDENDNILGTYTATSTSTLTDFFNAISSYGLTGSITNGIISVTSEDGKYVEDKLSGGVLEEMGISTSSKDITRTITTPVTTTSGNTMTSSSQITYSSDGGTASASATFGDLTPTAISNGNNVIYIKNSSGDILGTYTATSTSTLNNFFNAINSHGISGSISNGIITLSSEDGIYVEDKNSGGVLSELGISTTSSSQTRTLTTTVTTTIGNTVTSSSEISYTVDGGTASSSTTFGELTPDAISNGNNRIYIKNSDGTILGSFMATSTSTVDDFFNAVSSYGISGSISNGVISLSSEDGIYVDDQYSGGVLSELGISTTSSSQTRTLTTTVTTTSGNTMTSSSRITYEQTSYADSSTSLSALGISTVSNGLTINVNGVDQTMDTSGITTLGELFSKLSSDYGITASISNGKITVNSTSSKYINGGSYATALGITTVNNGTSTTTVGKSVSSSSAVQVENVTNTTITTTTAAPVTESTTLGEIGIALNSKFTNRIIRKTQAEAEAEGYTWVTTRAQLTTALNNNQKVMLGSNIDLSASDWTPISSYSNTFDGNGYIISGMSVSSTTSSNYAGFFGSISGATIKNLGFEDGHINTDAHKAGIIAGYAASNSTISNCFVSNSDLAVGGTFMSNVGGFVGHLEGSYITDSNILVANIEYLGTDNGGIGGIAGYASSTSRIDNCVVFTLDLAATNTAAGQSNSLGGIVGIVDTTLIRNSSIYRAMCMSVGDGDNYFGVVAGSGAYLSIDCISAGVEDMSHNLFGANGTYITYIHGSQAVDITTGYKSSLYESLMTNNFVVWNNTSNQTSEGTLLTENTKISDIVSYLQNTLGYTDVVWDSDLSGIIDASGNIGLYGALATNGDPEATFEDVTIQTVTTTTTTETTTVNATYSTTLGELGLNGDQIITVRAWGTLNTYTFNSSSTLDDIQNDIGLNADGSVYVTINNGIVTFSPETNGVLVGMSSELANALHINVGKDYSYTENVTTLKSNSTNGATFYQTIDVDITDSTTFGDLGLSPSGVIATIVQDGTAHAITASSSTTLSELGQYGITATFANGKITLTPSSGSYFTYLNSSIASALGLSNTASSMYSSSTHDEENTYSTTLISNTDSDQQNLSSTVYLNENTTFDDLGLSFNNKNVIDITQDGWYHGVYLNSSDKISDLAQYGITASFADGKLTLTPGENSVIEWMSSDIANALGLPTSGFYSTSTNDEESTYSTTLINNTDSNQQRITGTYSITGSTTFGDLGLSPSGVIATIVQDGTAHAITASSSTTLSELGQYGITATFANGKITLTPSSGSYFTYLDSNVASALGLSNTASAMYSTSTHNEENPYVTTVPNNTNSDLQSLSPAVYLNENTTFADLGMSFSGKDVMKVNYNGSLYTITLNSTAKVSDLAQYGISASFSADGKLTLTPGANSYITYIDSEVASALGLQTSGFYTTSSHDEENTYTTDLVSNTDSDIQMASGQQQISSSTTLNDIGINIPASSEMIIATIIQNGTEHKISVSSDSATLQSICNQFAGYGISATVSGGRFVINDSDSSYVSAINSTFANALNLSTTMSNYISIRYGNTEVYTQDNASDKLEKSGSETITDSTTMGSIGFSGTSYIYVNDNGTSKTVTVTSSTTISDLRAKLGSCNISTTLSNGYLTISNSENSYVTSVDSNIKTALKLNRSTGYEEVVNSGYINTPSGQQYETIIATLTTATTISSILDYVALPNGNGDLAIHLADGSYATISVDASQTLGSLFNTLSAYGLVGTVTNGIARISSSDSNVYLESRASSGGSQIMDALWLSDLQYGDTQTITTNDTSDTFTVTTTAIATGSGVLEKLAYSDGTKITFDAGNNVSLVVSTTSQTGKVTTKTLQFSKTSTLNDICSALSSLGITASINSSGKFTAQSSTLSDFSFSGELGNFLTGNSLSKNYSKDISSASSQLNTNNSEISDIAANWDTLLSDLGISEGEYWVYQNGVRHTLVISAGETLASFRDALKSYGLNLTMTSGANGSILSLVGNGNSYIQTSTNAGASDVVTKLFNDDKVTTYSYEGMLEVSDVQQIAADGSSKVGDIVLGGVESIAGDLVISVNGVQSKITISNDDTIDSVLERLRTLGLEATISDGKIMIQSGYNSVAIDTSNSTSSLANPSADTGLIYADDLGGYCSSSDAVIETTENVTEKVFSVANYADLKTTLGSLNIQDGNLTIYRDGQKATVDIKSGETFEQLHTRINNAFDSRDVSLQFVNGCLRIFSSQEGVDVKVGSTTDKGNFVTITGLENQENGIVKSSRELYRVNTDSLITTENLFRKDDVREGSFIIGDAIFTIDASTKLSDIISQINTSEGANATAYWDNVDGKLIIKSRTTGASYINIEAGTSNFTDVMGWTNSEWNADNSVKITKMKVDSQELGDNAKIKINGTVYTSASNTIKSDVSRIDGVTLDLKGLSEGSTVTVTVEKDKETVANALSDVLDAYNELMKKLDEQLASTGDLHSESTLKLIRNQLRNLMTGSDPGATVFRNLDAIGIRTSAASASNLSTSNEHIINLSFDKDKFMNAYSTNSSAVKALLIGGENNKGILTNVEELLDSTLASVSGYFAVTEKSYTDKINNMSKKITKNNEAIDRYRSRLETKFSAMDMIISKLQQQYSSFLS